MRYDENEFLDSYEDYEEPEMEYYDYVEIQHETDKSYLVKTKIGRFWAPKSIARLEEGNVLCMQSFYEPKYLDAEFTKAYKSHL